ncbi:hypothetical protein CR513_32319, partial [Mucuna pruriens]
MLRSILGICRKWNEISLQIRGMWRASIESWEELKKEISIDEYFKEMEVTLIRAQIVEPQ